MHDTSTSKISQFLVRSQCTMLTMSSYSLSLIPTKLTYPLQMK